MTLTIHHGNCIDILPSFLPETAESSLSCNDIALSSTVQVPGIPKRRVPLSIRLGIWLNWTIRALGIVFILQTTAQAQDKNTKRVANPLIGKWIPATPPNPFTGAVPIAIEFRPNVVIRHDGTFKVTYFVQENVVKFTLGAAWTTCILKTANVAVCSEVSANGTAYGAFVRAGDPCGEFKAGRAAYEAEVRSLREVGSRLKGQGLSEEEIAKRLNASRRAIGEKYNNITPEPYRSQIAERNMRDYNGDPLGPTFKFLIGQGKTPQQIIDSSSRPGGENIIPEILEDICGE